MKIHLLDMGLTKYGDCLVIDNGNRRILIDGAHPGDANSVRTQLKKILGQEPPFAFDLLVVTHCHSDHIGCLPDLVAMDVVRFKKALIADEKLGFGRAEDGTGPSDAPGLTGTQKTLIAAIQEEDHSSLSDGELMQFLDDAGTLETKYIQMLKTFMQTGTPVLRYGRDLVTDNASKAAAVKAFEDEFADFGLHLLGPTQDHLLICADQIARGGSDAADAAAGADDNSILNTYRRMVAEGVGSDEAEGKDMPGTGAAKNCQSIVLKVTGDDGWSALLAGDMQFAKPEIGGLKELMPALLKKSAAAGTYGFIKLTHHTAYNALDETVYQAFKQTDLFAHTGGRNDVGHPFKGALDVLKNHLPAVEFARNDRNGIITVGKMNGKLQFTLSQGALNDFSLNKVSDATPEGRSTAASATAAVAARASAGSSPVIGRQVTPLPNSFVEVHTKLPHRKTRVTITIDVDPAGDVGQGEGLAPGHDNPLLAAEMRQLPPLVVISSFPKLAANIGAENVSRLKQMLAAQPQLKVLDLAGDLGIAESAAPQVNALLHGGKYKGVLIIGGYDVIPAQRLSVLNAALRQELIRKNQLAGDADEFIVWSDDLYADPDMDGLPELPVSRIPDGGDAVLMFAALSASDFSVQARFGIRNTRRPFAEGTFAGIPGSVGILNVSEECSPEHIAAGDAAGAVYYMLHGSDQDASRFWGETQDGEEFEAVCLDNIPGSTPGTVVFTGCCWGALSVYQPASGRRGLAELKRKTAADSIALAYLKSGAQAFVGCTGSHYSPLQSPYNYYGKPMHDAFWQGMASGFKPAEALFRAKVAYAQAMPHGRTDPFSQAVEIKILREYTCIGLGW
ncbi:MAG: hypothetical protein JWP78_2059 [Mucilaginibacter sp.]|nr:hypothetical protein [Mucilaginibacter sp.]